MWKKYKVISWILMMVFLISAFGKADYQAVAQESNVKKKYIIVTETKSVYKDVYEEIKDDICEETPLLEEKMY